MIRAAGAPELCINVLPCNFCIDWTFVGLSYLATFAILDALALRSEQETLGVGRSRVVFGTGVGQLPMSKMMEKLRVA